MKCPLCGTEFEGVVEQCFTCGWDFAENPADYRPRISKLAIFTLILGILCLFTLYLSLLATVIIGAIALRKIRKSRGKLTGERIAMAGILIPLLSLPIIPAIGYAIWSKDAGPVPNEFTEADFLQVRSENEVTYSILCQLNDGKDDPNGAPAIGLNKEDVVLLENLWETFSESEDIQSQFESIRKHAEDIQYLWNQSSKGHSIITELSSYDEIADLTEVFADLDSDVPYNRDIKLLLEINVLHSLLLLENGDDLQACRELIVFDTMVRKQGIFARSMILKLICYAIFSHDIKAANLMANHPDISKEGVHLLRSQFSPLSDEEVSLGNSIIHEYLMDKNVMENLSETVNTPLYKQNSSYRYLDGFCRNWILKDKGQKPNVYCPVSVWPWEKPYPQISLEIGRIMTAGELYDLYNPIGTLYVETMLPAVDRIFEIKEKILIWDDLLQWVLAKRMGQEGSLKSRAYSDEYTVDIEKGLVFSVGPDGEAYTNDDVKLRINPEVLGLIEKVGSE